MCLVAVCLAALAPGASGALPTSVTIAGSLQSELGCPGDFDPACTATRLAYDATDDVWQKAFSLPAGSWSYKAALNDSWDENYGLGAVLNGPNVDFALAAPGTVTFYYDPVSHWVTDSVSSTIVVAAGSFQSELGCASDWDPGCLRSWLQDVDRDGTYTRVTEALPPGGYETKAALNESWDVNYGAGGVADGPNIPFTVPSGGASVTFSYVASTHVLTITVIAADSTPPTIDATRAPAANANGWNNTDVVVTFTCADEPGGSGGDTLTPPVTLGAEGAGQSATGTCTDKAGNSASATVSGISIDKTQPLVAFSGNAGTYAVDQTVTIACTATDAPSGIASSTCAGVSAPAWSFGLGTHVLSAAATDRADNAASASTSFTVAVTPPSLCGLTEQLVRDSAKYRSGGKLQRLAADALTGAGCAALRALNAAPAAKRPLLVAAYRATVAGLGAGGWLTAQQATTLRSFAGAL